MLWRGRGVCQPLQTVAPSVSTPPPPSCLTPRQWAPALAQPWKGCFSLPPTIITTVCFGYTSPLVIG